MSDVVVDARGMRCPWPALRAARAMRDAASVLVMADDPAAPAEIGALAAARGWTFDRDGEEFRLKRSDPVAIG